LPEVKDAKYKARQVMAALALAAKNKKIDGKNHVGATEAVGAALKKRKAAAQPSAQPSTKKNKAAPQPSEEQPSKKKRKAAAQPSAQGGAPRRAKQPRATTTKQPALLTVRRALNTFQIYIVYLSRFVFKRT